MSCSRESWGNLLPVRRLRRFLQTLDLASSHFHDTLRHCLFFALMQTASRWLFSITVTATSFLVLEKLQFHTHKPMYPRDQM